MLCDTKLTFQALRICFKTDCNYLRILNNFVINFFNLPVKRITFLTDFSCILKSYLFSCAFLGGTGFRFLSPRVAVFPLPIARTRPEASGSNGRNL